MRSLRSAVGVRAPSLDRPEAARLVAGLAMAGVPIAAGSVAHDVARLLGPERRRRAHRARRPDRLRGPRGAQRGAAPAGAARVLGRGLAPPPGRAVQRRPASPPSVSVVLATKRPGHARLRAAPGRQAARASTSQLVLAPHGFDADPAQVRDLAGPRLARSLVLRPSRRVDAVRRRARRRRRPPPTATWC